MLNYKMLNKKSIFTLLTGTLVFSLFLPFWQQLSVLYANPLKILAADWTAFLPVLYLSLSLTLILPLITLLVTLNIEIKQTLAIYFLSSFASLLFFKLNLLIIALGLSLTLSILYFDITSRKDLQNQIKPKPTTTFFRTYSTLLTILALIISFGYYPATSKQIKTFKVAIPKQVQHEVFKLLSNTLNIEPKLAETATKETVFEPLFQQLEVQINNLVSLYRPLLPAVFALSLFAALKVLSPPIVLCSLLIFNLIWWNLKFLKVVKVERIKKECEVLTL